MIWLKREIFIILSFLLLVFSSCSESKPNAIEKLEIKENSKKELIRSFFAHLQNWNNQSYTLIDSIGQQISQMDSTLRFLPFNNSYEKNTFIFTSPNIHSLAVFEESEFLAQSQPIVHSFYKIWRKKINGLQLLDLSIEPHPTLEWIFAIRLRSQE